MYKYMYIYIHTTFWSYIHVIWIIWTWWIRDSWVSGRAAFLRPAGPPAAQRPHELRELSSEVWKIVEGGFDDVWCLILHETNDKYCRCRLWVWFDLIEFRSMYEWFMMWFMIWYGVMQFQTTCYCVIVHCEPSQQPRSISTIGTIGTFPPCSLSMRSKACFQENFWRSSNLKNKRSTLKVYSEMLLRGSKMLVSSAFSTWC